MKHRGAENCLNYDLSNNSVIENDPLVKTKLLGLNLGKLNSKFLTDLNGIFHGYTIYYNLLNE